MPHNRNNNGFLFLLGWSLFSVSFWVFRALYQIAKTPFAAAWKALRWRPVMVQQKQRKPEVLLLRASLPKSGATS